MPGIFDDEEVELAHRVRQHIREGWSNEEIGAELDMAPSVVNWYLLLWYTYMTDAGEGKLERVLTFDERVFRYENLLCPVCSATLKESFFASSISPQNRRSENSPPFLCAVICMTWKLAVRGLPLWSLYSRRRLWAMKQFSDRR